MGERSSHAIPTSSTVYSGSAIVKKPSNSWLVRLSGDWIVYHCDGGTVKVYILVVNIERFRFNLHAKGGWMIAGAVCGARVGSLPPTIRNSSYMLEARFARLRVR